MLLSQAGLKIKIIKPDVSEEKLRGENARDMVLRLSIDKAEAGWNSVRKFPALILAADTCVVAPGGTQVLGKPRNKSDAESMLRRIQGKEHVVFTGYCILASSDGRDVQEIARVVKSRVRIRKMSADEIQWYVSTGEPMDKAGSYAAQGIGMAFIESIVGSYSNVVGLPLCEVMQDLKRLGAWR